MHQTWCWRQRQIWIPRTDVYHSGAWAGHTEARNRSARHKPLIKTSSRRTKDSGLMRWVEISCGPREVGAEGVRGWEVQDEKTQDVIQVLNSSWAISSDQEVR